MAKVQLAARILLGLIYFVFGGMGLCIALGIMHPTFPPMPAAAETFMKGIMATGYFFPLLKVTETACGFLMLFNIAAPLALVIIAPVTLHIILFNVFLTTGGSGLVLPVIMVVLQVVAMAGYWNLYQPLFGKK